MSNKYVAAAGVSFLVAAGGGLERLINGDISGLIVEISGIMTGFSALGKYAYDRVKEYLRNPWKYKF